MCCHYCGLPDLWNHRQGTHTTNAVSQIRSFVTFSVVSNRNTALLSLVIDWMPTQTGFQAAQLGGFCIVLCLPRHCGHSLTHHLRDEARKCSDSGVVLDEDRVASRHCSGFVRNPIRVTATCSHHDMQKASVPPEWPAWIIIPP